MNNLQDLKSLVGQGEKFFLVDSNAKYILQGFIPLHDSTLSSLCISTSLFPPIGKDNSLEYDESDDIFSLP